MEKARHDAAVNHEYVLRRAAPDDAQFVLDVQRICMDAYVKSIWPDFIWPEVAAHLNCEAIKIITFKNRDVGYVETSAQPGEIFLDSLYVLPEYQGLGLGSKILLEIKGNCARSGIALRLSVLKNNARAKMFYIREGFRVCKETHDRFHMEAI